jgi:prepilin-type N-terminal cleavage/methylation domain-containing protein
MRRHPISERAGFTLAEVMVTLLIVSIGLLLVTQGLQSARFSSADAHYRKVARELAQLTLGRLESGLMWEELDGGGEVLTGTYAEEGYEECSYEMVLGDEEFLDAEGTQDERYEDDGFHDSWQYEREREERERERSDDDEEEDEIAEAFEKVRVKVTYPKFGERPNTFVIERWIPWEQVYGVEEGEEPESGGEGSK